MSRPALLSSSLAGRQQGFTLIEMISVMVLIGILAAVVFPRFAGTQSFQQRILADQLQNLILQARLQALSRETQTIILDVKRQQQWLIQIWADTNQDGTFDLQLVSEQFAQTPETLLLTRFKKPAEALQTISLTFDQRGNIQSLNDQPLHSNLFIQAATKSICVTPSGLARNAPDNEDCQRG